MPDHVHILFGMRPTQSVSELMQDIKGDSSKWINSKKFLPGKFSWQEGYGAFSYGRSQLSQVIKYIEKQQEHHKKKTFLEEYKEFLEAFEIEHDVRFLFKPIAD
jgi:REP element-mobilizing transposase RayT